MNEQGPRMVTNYCRECAKLADQLAAAQEIIDRLNDDDLADRVGRMCNDPYHDDRWCATCEARLFGIEDYQRAVKEGKP